MITDYAEGKEVWVITRHSINANTVSAPVRGVILERAPGWAFAPHVKVEVAGKKITVPAERCFENKQDLIQFLKKVLKKREQMTMTAYSRYKASEKETNNVSNIINSI